MRARTGSEVEWLRGGPLPSTNVRASQQFLYRPRDLGQPTAALHPDGTRFAVEVGGDNLNRVDPAIVIPPDRSAVTLTVGHVIGTHFRYSFQLHGIRSSLPKSGQQKGPHTRWRRAQSTGRTASYMSSYMSRK